MVKARVRCLNVETASLNNRASVLTGNLIVIKESLFKKLSNPDVDHHISSCQFVIHYTFESEEQADMIVRNACSSLCDGGYFIGTTVNDAKLM